MSVSQEEIKERERERETERKREREKREREKTGGGMSKSGYLVSWLLKGGRKKGEKQGEMLWERDKCALNIARCNFCLYGLSDSWSSAGTLSVFRNIVILRFLWDVYVERSSWRTKCATYCVCSTRELANANAWACQELGWAALIPDLAFRSFTHQAPNIRSKTQKKIIYDNNELILWGFRGFWKAFWSNEPCSCGENISLELQTSFWPVQPCLKIWLGRSTGHL